MTGEAGTIVLLDWQVKSREFAKGCQVIIAQQIVARTTQMAAETIPPCIVSRHFEAGQEPKRRVTSFSSPDRLCSVWLAAWVRSTLS